ncbi:MAG: DUF4271 domain-containing protein [Bacteroidia bacterium]|nr:DUF4271 domain-containing protein [Bacteroidia bacterium]
MNTVPHAHIFSDHLLPSSGLQAIPLQHSNEPIWISAYLLTGLVILTTVKKYSVQDVLRTLQFGFSFQTQRKFERKEIGRAELFPQLLNLFFVLNLSFLAYSVNQRFSILLQNTAFTEQVLFFTCMILLILAYKAFMNAFLKSISSKGKFIQEYQLVSGSINRISGLLLFPLLLLLGFSEINANFLLIASLVLVGLMLLIKWVKGLLLGISEDGLGILQILTYFCALEILPQLVLVKYTIETFKAG